MILGPCCHSPNFTLWPSNTPLLPGPSTSDYFYEKEMTQMTNKAPFEGGLLESCHMEKKKQPLQKKRRSKICKFFLTFLHEKVSFYKNFLKGFCLKRKNVLFEKACQKNLHIVSKDQYGKNVFFTFFSRFANFFERVFALNNFFVLFLN